jgi:pyruvate kinase
MTTNQRHKSARDIQMLCTLGPSSLNKQVIERLTDRGVDFFRINMSHTSLEALEEVIRTIRSYSSTPICVDSEGAQVRTGELSEPIVFKDRQRVKLCRGRVQTSEGALPLWPDVAFDQLETGHLIAVDFDSTLLMVREVRDGEADAVVINGGNVAMNKAVSINPPPVLPPLSEKDIATVEIAKRHRIENFALSFANSPEDVQQLRSLVGPEATIISKIESVAGVRNLDGILNNSDAILIDRGDLSREVPLENIPLIQKSIIQKANAAHTPVYVATNLLESMMTNRKPTRAELNDVVNTLMDGASGLVLAAETAIGDHPVVAVDMLATLIERFEMSLEGFRISDLLENTSPLLPALHGNPVKSRPWFTNSYNFEKMVENLPAVRLTLEDALDTEQLANGAFSPLAGFMDEPTLESVLDNNRLPSGDIWTMPILLQVPEDQIRDIQPGMSVRLEDPGTDKVLAVLHVQDKYQIDLPSVARRWFGTTEREHPGVDRLFDRGNMVLGGPIEQVSQRDNEWSHYNLTPSKTRMIFGMKGWSKIVAFHTRNVPHKGHEHVIHEALERANADGLFIHPVIGPKKSGDFVPEAILGVYDRLIEDSLPGALLGAFMTYPRYCGPREAVFTALCRKNFGCTHFIIGRDHAGVGSYYADLTAQDLIESLGGDLGIELIYFDPINYSKSQDTYVEDSGTSDDYESISGSFVRESLRNGTPIPQWCLSESTSSWLQERIDSGASVFVE